jgi:hypothetical protein
MFGLDKRRKRNRFLQVEAEVSAIQRYLFDQIRPSLTTAYGYFEGGQLAQSVIDRLFARPVALAGKERLLVDRLSRDLLKGNESVRQVAFSSLRAILEVEGARNNFPAERRILDTVEWLKQFGGLPAGIPLSEALTRLRTLEVSIPNDSEPEPESQELDEKTPIDDRHDVNVVPPPSPSGGPQGDTWQIT